MFGFRARYGFPCKAHKQKHFLNQQVFGAPGGKLQSFFRGDLVIKTNHFAPLKQVHSLSIRILSSMKFSHRKQTIKNTFRTNLFGGKIFEAFLEIIITNRFASSNQVHPCLFECWTRYGFSPCKADQQNTFRTTMFRGQLFQGFLELFITNHFESSNQLHSLFVRILSLLWFLPRREGKLTKMLLAPGCLRKS